VCTKRNLGCDLATMKSKGNSSDFLSRVGMFTNCTGPVMPGCSAASPSVGLAGCFYHSDTCVQPPTVPAPVVNNVCSNMTSCSGHFCGYQENSCCMNNGQKWCCNYGVSGPPTFSLYNDGWGCFLARAGLKGNCTTPSTLTVPVRLNPGVHAITCEATKSSTQDGQRICACSANGQRVANSASAAGLPVALFFVLSLIALL